MIDQLIQMNRHLRITLLLLGFSLSILLMPFVGGFWFVTFLFAFVFLGILIYTNIQYSKKYSSIMELSLDQTLSKLSFSADDSFLSDDYLSGIAISEENKEIAILQRNNKSEAFSLKRFDFEDIIECSIKEDGETLTETSKGSMIGSTAIGGLLAGGVGAVVGGLSANKNSTEQIFKASLNIVVNDLDNPVHTIHFLNSNMLVTKNSDIYQNIYSEMNKWHKRISVVMKRNELNTQSI